MSFQDYREKVIDLYCGELIGSLGDLEYTEELTGKTLLQHFKEETPPKKLALLISQAITDYIIGETTLYQY